MRVIITGVTGMVGEGVLMECLQNQNVSEILIIGRRHYDINHPKIIKELLITDFNKLGDYVSELQNFDACFYCAGVSSVGMKEKEYNAITYDTTLSFAKVLYGINPQMVFHFVTGAQTNINGKSMWQRVKGRTEVDLMKLGFRGQFNFRPGFMKPFKGQKNVKWFFKPLIGIFSLILGSQALTLSEVGKAMINLVQKDNPKQILEISDIKALSK